MACRPVLLQPLVCAALRLLGAALLALIAPGLAGPAFAHAQARDSLAATCHAYAETRPEANALRAGGPGWVCDDSQLSADSRRVLLRFELGPDGKVPAQLTSRLARFEAMRFDIVAPDGSVRSHTLFMRDFTPHRHMGLQVALPEVGSPARQVIVTLIGPTVPALASNARLHAVTEPSLSPRQIWIAVLCGVLLVPLFFNLALYRALRDRFLLWHVAVVGFMLAHSLVTSGLTPFLAPLPAGSLALLIAVTFCGGAACAIMMACEFIEQPMLDDSHRKALQLAALGVIVNGAWFIATVDWLQGAGTRIYFANWLIALGVIAWAVGIAQRVAIGLEVLIGSAAIADRFIQLRRDRDDQQQRVSELAELAERDPLTGLRNRRSIESRFVALRSDGFTTLALIDLDHFKSINDRFGHTVGDHVLQSVAASLPEDRDIIAMRMGGEEFMLLLRGKDAGQRAERVRQAITTRVARDIPGLDRPVTASMGVVEIPAAVMPDATFAAIYARADALLYQAKRAGRNRMVAERMTVFADHIPQRLGIEAA
ncbi:MAG: diguanylate cyclase [Sphingomonadaceae bacterium]|nr:diguanylate cyclase [Sphingomonadaceae bacterium]